MKYTQLIDIAVGKTRKTGTWRNIRIDWGELVFRVSETTTTDETIKQYLSYTKDKQDEIKDVGGFVGGYLINGKRNNQSVKFRQVGCLDIDFGGWEIWEAFEMLDVAGCVYSTHKHQPENPRLRIIFPLSRKVASDEYEALTRQVASWLGIDAFDDTTYQPARLMYYPSTSKDAEFLFSYNDAPFLDVDEVLAELEDWRDPTCWAISSREKDKVKRARADKSENPHEKAGVIGAFNRAYDIHSAIGEFLEDIYTPCDTFGELRYSYVGGSTSGGLVVYDDVHAYSHHASDVAGQQLVNSFDLVRLHKFGDLDENKKITDHTKAPSFRAMTEFASQLKEVKREVLAKRREENTVDDFDEVEDIARKVGESDEWIEKLELEKNGDAKNTISNVVLVLSNDENLAGKLGYNAFEQRETATAPLPWDKGKKLSYPRPLEDADDSYLRQYLETVYKLTNRSSITDGMVIVLRDYTYHPVRDYLDGLEWDGKRRLERLFVDVLGAPDIPYIHAVTRKAFTAGVARIYNQGCKFDYITTILGDQGIGKSTLLDVMGGDYFSDSLTKIEGKDAMENIQGAWLLELGEMAGLRKAEVNSVKAFASKRVDKFRVAYGKRVEHFPRRCVFFATSNEDDPLRDVTGNRRFWIVSTFGGKPSKSIEYVKKHRDQLWAEAKHYYKEGELLYLDSELESVARNIQDSHLEKDERQGLVLEFLNRKLPKGWDSMELYSRRAWLADADSVGTEERTEVSTLEIWSEAFNREPNLIQRKDSFEIGRILKTAPNWVSSGKAVRVPIYGTQKTYHKRN